MSFSFCFVSSLLPAKPLWNVPNIWLLWLVVGVCCYLRAWLELWTGVPACALSIWLGHLSPSWLDFERENPKNEHSQRQNGQVLWKMRLRKRYNKFYHVLCAKHHRAGSDSSKENMNSISQWREWKRTYGCLNLFLYLICPPPHSTVEIHRARSIQEHFVNSREICKYLAG